MFFKIMDKMSMDVDVFDETAYLEEVRECLENKILDPEHENTPKYKIRVICCLYLIYIAKHLFLKDTVVAKFQKLKFDIV